MAGAKPSSDWREGPKLTSFPGDLQWTSVNHIFTHWLNQRVTDSFLTWNDYWLEVTMQTPSADRMALWICPCWKSWTPGLGKMEGDVAQPPGPPLVVKRFDLEIKLNECLVLKTFTCWSMTHCISDNIRMFFIRRYFDVLVKWWNLLRIVELSVLEIHVRGFAMRLGRVNYFRETQLSLMSPSRVTKAPPQKKRKQETVFWGGRSGPSIPCGRGTCHCWIRRMLSSKP